MRSISSNQSSGGGSGRKIPLVESEDHAHGFLFELSEVSCADITATVALIPRSPRTVRHLKLIMEEDREGGILEGDREKQKAEI